MSLSARDCPLTLEPDMTTRPATRAALWTGFLVPFFFASYGLANWLAAQCTDVGSIVFAWERHIPFLAWTIVPYWSIDALYGLSLFFCRSGKEVDRVAKRLLSAQVVAVACFILFPLALTSERPEITGWAGPLFALLESFDGQHNMTPSLHIALLVILWTLYAKHVPRRWAWALHAWCALIGVSVLTTWQHHFIDVPTGALLGWFCVWLWPANAPSPLAGLRVAREGRAWRLAAFYALGACAVAGSAFAIGGWALWLLWPSVSLLLVAAAYDGLGTSVFQKGADGRMSAAARCLLAPYLIVAWINSRLWTRRDPAPVHIRDGVWLGRFPSARGLARQEFAAIVDLSAELPAPKSRAAWHAFPSLDLVTPKSSTLRSAARIIERRRAAGPVLVCCALGYSRSAAAVASWLLMSKRSQNLTKALAAIRTARPRSVLTTHYEAAIAEAAGPRLNAVV
jgi:protein-tyrosine phosphatase/membrane-associated phospholipid phosphatase